MKNNIEEKIDGNKVLDILFIPSSFIRIQKRFSSKRDSLYEGHERTKADKIFIYTGMAISELARLALYYQGIIKILDYF